MDFFSAAIGAVTGIEAAHWGDILIFGLKSLLLCVPFVILGLLLDRDIYSVPMVNRIIKMLVVTLFVTPVILIGVLNYYAESLGESFWERYPLLENFWIMEGKWPPIIIIVLAVLFLLLYLAETVGGDLRR